MITDFTVNIDYVNKDLKAIGSKTYSLEEYSSMLCNETKWIISDVENSFIELTGKPKSQWDDTTKAMFEKIRHALLDTANSFARLPRTLRYKGIPANSMSFDEFLDKNIGNIKLEADK